MNISRALSERSRRLLLRITVAAIAAALTLAAAGCAEPTPPTETEGGNGFVFPTATTTTGENGFTFPTSPTEGGTPTDGTTAPTVTTKTAATTAFTPASGEIAVTEQNVSLFGRHYFDDRFDTWFFNWTLGGFSLTFEGTGIDAEFYTNHGLAEESTHPYLGIIVDGKRQSDVVIRENGWATLASGLPKGKHTVSVYKLNESMLNAIGVKAVRPSGDGKLLAPPALPARRIEIIGDSITAGYGNIPPYDAPALTSAIEDGLQTYGGFLMQEFNADVRVEAISGGAIYRDYLGNISAMYKKFCQCDYFDTTPYDFSEWKPDLVIINLGSNDVQLGSSAEEYQSGGEKWIETIRSRYGKDVQILWTYGVLNQVNDGRTRKLVESFKQKGDTKIAYVPLEPVDIAADGIGSGGHPTVATHRKMAATLAAAIRDSMGW